MFIRLNRKILSKTSIESQESIIELDITDGLKQLLIDAGITLESIIGLDYQQVADMLHTDPYVGKLIVETLHNLMQEKNQ